MNIHTYAKHTHKYKNIMNRFCQLASLYNRGEEEIERKNKQTTHDTSTALATTTTHRKGTSNGGKYQQRKKREEFVVVFTPSQP